MKRIIEKIEELKRSELEIVIYENDVKKNACYLADEIDDIVGCIIDECIKNKIILKSRRLGSLIKELKDTTLSISCNRLKKEHENEKHDFCEVKEIISEIISNINEQIK